MEEPTIDLLELGTAVVGGFALPLRLPGIRVDEDTFLGVIFDRRRACWWVRLWVRDGRGVWRSRGRWERLEDPEEIWDARAVRGLPDRIIAEIEDEMRVFDLFFASEEAWFWVREARRVGRRR